MKQLKLSMIIAGLKLISVITFGILFLSSAIETVKMYKSGLKTSSRSIVPLNPSKGLLLPTLVLCNKTGFKSNTLFNDMETFNKNTIDLEDIIIDIKPDKIQGQFDYTINTVYSVFQGRCYAIKIHDHIHKKVAENAVISIKPDVDLLAYALEPGFEFFIILEFWIKKPKILYLEKNWYFYDLFVSKEVKHWRPMNCLEMESSEYIGG